MKKKYKCIQDYQGGSFCVGHNLTIKQWQRLALEFASMDNNSELYNYIKSFKPTKRLLLEIMDIWQIELVAASRHNYKKLGGAMYE